MSKQTEFSKEVARNVEAAGRDAGLLDMTYQWIERALAYNYAHNFSWLGRPVIQVPQDIYAAQELFWKVKPDLVIETGIAHGGSLILSASMLALLDYCDAVQNGKSLNPLASRRKVLGVDIDIREHNRKAIEEHPMAHLIEMIQGSSIASDVVTQVHEVARNYEKILVCLDSNHTHEHVLAELEAYAPLVSVGSYCIVWDTGLENMPQSYETNRPWGKGNNPKTAVMEYLRRLHDRKNANGTGAHPYFEIDKFIENKLLITASSDGFLKRVS